MIECSSWKTYTSRLLERECRNQKTTPPPRRGRVPRATSLPSATSAYRYLSFITPPSSLVYLPCPPHSRVTLTALLLPTTPLPPHPTMHRPCPPQQPGNLWETLIPSPPPPPSHHVRRLISALPIWYSTLLEW